MRCQCHAQIRNFGASLEPSIHNDFMMHKDTVSTKQHDLDDNNKVNQQTYGDTYSIYSTVQQ